MAITVYVKNAAMLKVKRKNKRRNNLWANYIIAKM